MPKQHDVERLKTIVKKGMRHPDQWFAENETVVIPLTGGRQYRCSLRVRLLAYAYGLGDERGDDEPES